MRRLAFISVFVCFGAAAHAETASATRPDKTTRPENLAGLYWIPYVTCPDDCAPPAALAAYVTSNEATARRTKAALDGKLAFGLPWVIHTDQLDNGGSRLVVPQRGIAVVIGSFSSRKAARAAAAKAPVIDGLHATVIDIASAKTTKPFGDKGYGVTTIDRGAAVPAWSAKDLRAAEKALENVDVKGDYTTALATALKKRPPLCTVKPGELFRFRVKDLKWYELAPVRCGNQLAYVEWTASLLGHAVVVRDGTGYRLYQVVEVTCDVPTIRSWHYDENGRHATKPKSILASAGC